MKIKARVMRKDNGKFQAMVQNQLGHFIWACEHDHTYGTSNRMKQDSASKCAHSKVLELRKAKDDQETAAEAG